MTVLRSGSASHVGRVRSTNQDRWLESSNLYAVADGMGGHAGGEVAASVAVESLQAAFSRQPTVEGLRDAVVEANTAIWNQSLLQSDLRGMGTTLTAAALVSGSDGRDLLALANVGDSRAYLYSEGRIVQVTADHSLAEEKVRHGEMSEAEAAVHPHRHILTRALGVSSGVEVDLWELRVQSGDRLVLCSDGLTNEVDIHQLGEVLATVEDPTEAAGRLVDLANESGGNDNITVVVVDVVLGDDGQPTTIAPVGSAAALPLVLTGARDPGTGEAVPAPGPGPTATAAVGEPPASAVPPGPPEPPDSGSGDNVTAMIAAQAAGPASRGSDLSATAMVPAVGAGVATAVSDDFFVGTRSVPPATSADYPPNGSTAAEPPSWRARRRQAGVPRLITIRVILFALLVAAVVVGAYLFVRWYATDNWYVTVRGQQLVIYQGRPGGLLWFRPKLVDETGVTTSQVLAVHVAALQADVEEPTLSDARHYVSSLKQEYESQLAVSQGGTQSSGGQGPNGTLPTIPPPISAPPTSTTTSPAPAPATTTTRPATTTTTTSPAATTTTTAPATTTTKASPPTTALRAGQARN
jgi:protein phosphatase